MRRSLVDLPLPDTQCRNLESQAFWQVDDVEKEVAELKSRGVIFEEYNMPGFKTVNGILSSEGNKAAWFKDTEGNIMALIQGGA